MLLYAYFTPKVDFKRKFNHHQSFPYEWRLTVRTIRKFRIGPSIRIESRIGRTIRNRIESRSFAGPYLYYVLYFIYNIIHLHLFYYHYDDNCVSIQIHILRRARTKTRLSLSSLHSPTPSRRDSITWISADNGSCQLFLTVTLSEIAVNKHRRSELCYRCSWRFSSKVHRPVFQTSKGDAYLDRCGHQMPSCIRADSYRRTIPRRYDKVRDTSDWRDLRASNIRRCLHVYSQFTSSLTELPSSLVTAHKRAI